VRRGGFVQRRRDYTNGARHVQAFVVSQRHGIWGKARRVSGLAVLNKGRGRLH